MSLPTSTKPISRGAARQGLAIGELDQRTNPHCRILVGLAFDLSGDHETQLDKPALDRLQAIRLVSAPWIVVAMLAAAIVVLLAERVRHRSSERAPRDSDERFRLMTEQAPIMIWTTRPDATLDYLNSTCMAYTGLALEQMLDDGWLDAVHPDDRDRCVSTYVPAVAAREPLLMEYRVRRADGVYRWFMDSAVPKHDANGTFTGYIGCTIDITERREAEDRTRESSEALEASNRQIQHLAGRLIEAQDAERARVARDLHDDVSQQLAGLSIAFSGLKQQMGKLEVGEALQEDLRALQERTTAIAQNVRHLSHDLHPSVLRHAGLVAALTSYCRELERAHGTTVTCNAEGDCGAITEEAALCLYRIAQEALRNVIAHAGASRADVRLLCTGEIAEIAVADDGRGFDVAGAFEHGKGLGLVSINERVRLAGGTVSIVAEPKRGTRLSARIPTSRIAKAAAGAAAEHARREYSLS